MAVQNQQACTSGGRRRLALTALAVALPLLAIVCGAARAEPSKHAALVIDANNGRVLHASGADEPRHPASLAKLMTLYLVFEQIEQGRLTPQTRIKFSANAAGTAPSKLDVEEGEEIALIDAIKVLITKSANDVAVAIAEHVAGSEDKFARAMTQKARQLGMPATTFRNASGLHDEAQVTTARDMATLALRLQDDFPRHYALFATRTFTYKDDTFRNHNTLLFHYPGTIGLKTGYIRASGFNLAASVRREERHVVGVVFGGTTASTRNATMRTLLNMALLRASTERTRKPAPVLVVAARPPARPMAAVAPPPPLPAPPPPQRAARAAPPLPPAASTEEGPAPESLGPPVEIARVRPILLGQRPASEPAVPAAPALRLATIEDVLAQSGDGPAPEPEPAPPPMRRWASSFAGALGRPAAAPPPERPALLFDPVAARGSAPSTLDHQAANLARGEPPVPAPPPIAAPPPVAAQRLALPEPPPPAQAPQRVAAAAGAFQIQIGAYQSAAEAERQLAAVRERTGQLLLRQLPVTQEVRQGDKVLYRARYAGFEAQASALSACGELKRLKIDCVVARGE